MTNNKPKKLWASGVNLSGVYSDKPVRVTFHEELSGYDDKDYWYDKEGNFEINAVGVTKNDGSFWFSSESKEEVETFLLGASAVIHLLRRFTHDAEYEKEWLDTET